MQKVISTEKIPIKLWLDDMEEGALKQAKNLANLPFVFHHVAIMSDAHEGYGMPIGGVMATDNVIVPNAVGRDIGCGVCAVKTTLTEIDTETLKEILGETRRQIPVRFKKHKKQQEESLLPEYSDYILSFDSVVKDQYVNAGKSIGTLGGGNHFIEIQKDVDGCIWIMVHSGSRDIGRRVGDYYNKVAIELNEKWKSEVTKEKQLAFLPMDSEIGKQYEAEMRWCVDFAFKNRKLMMDRVKKIFEDKIYEKGESVEFEPMINIAHNYAALENHFNKNVWVHRKGATSSKEGEMGVIAGSQGTKSYIVIGKGNPESFMSCSHGAGRKLGRKQAERELDLEEEQRILDEQGILHALRGKKDLDEATGAYKDISVVMKNQEDLVEIVAELSPIAVVKCVLGSL
jgi:tRNA-splicing ligase RtcB